MDKVLGLRKLPHRILNRQTCFKPSEFLNLLMCHFMCFFPKLICLIIYTSNVRK